MIKAAVRSLVCALVFLIFSTTSFCQVNLPALAEVKMAAEHGDPKAQDKLADAYLGWLDETNALIWYRKAAEQGVANSQYHLGKALIGQGYNSMSRKWMSAEKVDEGLKWYIRSARQRFQLAEIGLGQLYDEGKLIKQDYVESYKWYSLAHNVAGLEVVGKVYRDRLILKMTQDQINEGQKRVERFLTTGGSDEPMPEPSFVDKLRLSGISGNQGHQLAIINNHNFAVGEDGQFKLDGRVVKVRCLEIRKNSVLIKAEGVDRVLEVRLK